jgi:murein DD-endopeptidase MepM/ murein hydrolase activator NlpD
MRFLLALALGTSFACGLASTSSATEHTVKKNETLTRIALHTGHSVRQLTLMNEQIKQPDRIMIGQKITYFDADDIADAISWCRMRINELPASDRNAEYFRSNMEDLSKNNVRYSINEPSGTHFSLILIYAQAWRARSS